ncbi:DUF695 domain-containing protein [Actinoplanes sp. HUAS TT8]|uniref:DUF695 domain-containing protein n=1 Tax=Actinoplanes sp. HUAS TT8 TaxID=3447453 RepID=UPI003F5249E5
MIFKRRRKTDPGTAIEAFWTWWATARPRAERLIAGDSDDALVHDLSQAVSAIHPELQWEFTAGSSSENLLVVSAAGDPELRALAERWRRAGPAPDGVFGYASARQGSPDALEGRLSIAGHELELAELRFTAEEDEDLDCVHVGVWHPAFPSMPDGARDQVAFLSLDWLLGEDVVEVWVGRIQALPVAGAPLTGARLAALVTELIPDEPRWRTMSGEIDGKPVIALAQTHLSPARWPGYDLHIRLDVPYRARDEHGFPDQPTLDALYALEDHVSAHADGAVVVAHETSDGVRSTHLYADRPAATHALEPLIAGWQDGRVRMTVTPDPRWEQVAHLEP